VVVFVRGGLFSRWWLGSSGDSATWGWCFGGGGWWCRSGGSDRVGGCVDLLLSPFLCCLGGV
jgi:hypothetical protein